MMNVSVGLMKQSVFRKSMQRYLFPLLASISILLAGCLGSDSEDDDTSDVTSEPQMFPQWDEVTDDGTNWSNDRLNGSAYIVIFSAQWCNTPCMNLMHSIWDTVPEIPVMVMSTDNGSEISFEDWHDAADAHDDEEGDENNNLTTYRFLLGDEEGNSLGIESPGTTIFVNKTGYITWQGKSSSANDPELIQEQWDVANLD